MARCLECDGRICGACEVEQLEGTPCPHSLVDADLDEPRPNSPEDVGYAQRPLPWGRP